MSASFKRRSQFWSLVLGVGLAVVANVDGVRLFQAFQAKPALTQNVMARQEQFREAYGQVESRKRAILDQQMKVTAARSALAQAQAKQPPDASQVAQAGKNLQVHESKLTALSNPEEIRRLAQETQSQVADLIALGVPVGSAYFPHCRLFGDDAASTTCTGPLWPSGDVQGLWAKRFQFLGHVLLWLIPVIITGVMIGLGAPFWFDVAKRLADVRQMFGGTASDETRLAARDANGDPEKRDAIVARVVDDAAGLTPALRRRLVP